MLLIAWLAPSTQELVGYEGPGVSMDGSAELRVNRQVGAGWEPTLRWAVAVGCLMGVSTMALSSVSEFLYFQF